MLYITIYLVEFSLDTLCESVCVCVCTRVFKPRNIFSFLQNFQKLTVISLTAHGSLRSLKWKICVFQVVDFQVFQYLIFFAFSVSHSNVPEVDVRLRTSKTIHNFISNKYTHFEMGIFRWNDSDHHNTTYTLSTQISNQNWIILPCSPIY